MTFVPSEQFNEIDVERYNLMDQKIENKFDLNEFIIPKYDFRIIDLPIKLFAHILMTKRPDLKKYLPMTVIVKKLENPEKSYWTYRTRYVGITDNFGNFYLHLRDNIQHSIVEILWILFHEFRHIVQFKNQNIRTNIYNSNLDLWLKTYTKEPILIEHVLHEIMPKEIDANIFACEMLEIDYPGSKFQLTEDTIKMLN